jgi:hypothetical protein
MKQTAVEWLINEFKANDWWYLPQSMKEDIIEQAKAMEKEQIIDAYLKDIGKVTIDKALVHWDKAEEYYNETFKS